jgi:hypothetical protein
MCDVEAGATEALKVHDVRPYPTAGVYSAIRIIVEK